VSVASRAGTLGQRKAAAMRVAERVLEETLATGQDISSVTNGTVVDGDTSYPWTLKSEAWTEDTMTELTVTVSFDVQGSTFTVNASTLYDPTAITASTVGSTTASP
jgi:hypothetical protein